jgi:hypothetical protein
MALVALDNFEKKIPIEADSFVLKLVTKDFIRASGNACSVG